ncbi:uncharacterized protein LOC128996627 [Macrosteles quadrilineatus]|uniref:uncharacterized protein LOC128996627 n=1 Tax=Macrosteles quadrilineatus TaxID=74068 RepID=UPI0023E14DA5|nr:uncharacterized protein LOC128996627 [Macrosteles quadrilineatus]
MAATDGQILVAAARWAEEGHYLREFVAKHRLPAVVKIIKGQYGGLGVPTLPNPGLQSSALLVSAGRRHKIVAQAIKMKEGRRVVGVGPRIAIPDTYQGYFELLSEEGRAVRCIESVLELARRRVEAGCLVREPIRAISARVESDGSVTADGARTVPIGETLFPAGEVQLGNSKGRYLRCVDSRGDTVLLGLEQRGRFSALAKEDNISGVHTAKNLLTKRMPLTVRLVHGTPPRGLKSSSQFVPELRLLSTFEEEHVFALPLQKDTGAVVALPLAAPIKLQKTRNEDQLKSLREFQRLVDKCGKLVGEVADRAHVLDGKLGESKALRLSGSSHAIAATKSGGYFLRRSASTDSANTHSHYYSNENRAPAAADDYDEIDQIYDYVRGFAPLPKSIRSPFPDTPSTPHEDRRSCSPTTPTTNYIVHPLTEELAKPEPPPIETIPTKKGSSGKAEKRSRKPKEPIQDKPPVTSMYIKSGNTQRGRIFRQKSSSPLKEHPPVVMKAGSPLFNIRYKSLSNLQQAMEMDGTLDSSHSGGRTSGDSGAGVKLPEKRSRRLSRPRSLTDLVWELKGEPERRKPPKPETRKNSASHKVVSGGHKRIGTLYL